MVIIDDILVSDEVLSEQFVCDLHKCKGGCCVEGDCGAPITDEEARLISEAYPHVKHLLSPEAIDLIETQGTHTEDDEFGLVTPTIDGGICAYGYLDDKGIVKCAFEALNQEGALDFRKPISCHLFPVRVTAGDHEFTAVNYEPRPVLCQPACTLGNALKVPVYKFLKEPLIRRFGADFYEALDATAQVHFQQK